MHQESMSTAEDRHLLPWQRIMLASGVVPLMIVGLSDLHGAAALPFIVAGTTGLAIGVKQLCPSGATTGDRPPPRP